MSRALLGRVRLLLVAFVLVVSSLSATALTASAAQAAPTKISDYVPLARTDHGFRVQFLQRFLKLAPATGYFDAHTERRVSNWQRAMQRPVTGRVDRFLWHRAVVTAFPPPKRKKAPRAGGDRVTRLNWGGLANCESGGNPRAVNPAGYYGLYQFSPPTWHSVGGQGMPHKASKGEQTKRAQILFRRQGAHPWPVCGKRLFR